VSAKLSEGGRIARNFAALSTAQAASAVAGLISTAVVARMLGTEGFGAVGFGVAMLSYFGLLVTLGTDAYAAREIAQDHARAPALLARVLGLRNVAMVLAGATYALIVAAIDVPERTRVVLWIQGAGLVSAAWMMDFVFQGLQRMGPIAARQTGASVLSLCIVLVFVRGPGDIYIAAAAPVIATIAGAAWLAWKLNRDAVPVRVTFRAGAWPAMLRISAPIAVAQMMGAVFFYVDIVMLGLMATPHETGIYVGMSRVLAMALIASGLINSVFMPVIAGAWPDSGPMRGRYRDFMTAAALCGAPIACAAIAFPGEIIAVIFGEAYLPGATALVLLMGMALGGYIGLAPTGALVSWHDQTWQMIGFSAGGVANIALNFALIPRFGIEGAAVATLLAQLVVLAVVIGRVRLRFGVFELGPAAALIAAAAVAAVIARLAADWALRGMPALVVLIGGGAIGGLVFIGLVVGLRIVPLARLRGAIAGRRGGGD
jgi:O-antigen/teichoic acid export membrane protein